MQEYTTPLNDGEQNPHCKGYSFSPEKATKANNKIFVNTPGWQTETERIERWKKFGEQLDESVRNTNKRNNKQNTRVTQSSNRKSKSEKKIKINKQLHKTNKRRIRGTKAGKK